MNGSSKNTSGGKASRYLLYRRRPEDCSDIAGEMSLLECQLREAALLGRTAVVSHLQLRGVDGRCVNKAPHQLIAMDRCRLHGPGQPKDGAPLQWALRTDVTGLEEAAAKVIDASRAHRISEDDNAADVLIRDLGGASPDSLQCFEAANPRGHCVQMPVAADIEELAHRTIAKLQGFDTPNLHQLRPMLRPAPLAPKQWETTFSHVWVDLRRQTNSVFAARRCLKKIARLVPECRIPFYVRTNGYGAGAAHRAVDLLKRHYDIRTRDDFEELRPYLARGEAAECQPWIIDCAEFFIMAHACVMFHSRARMRHDFSLLGAEAYMPKWRILHARGKIFAARMRRQIITARKSRRHG